MPVANYQERYGPVWDERAQQMADAQMAVLLGIFHTYLPMVVRERTGTATARNTTTRMVSVQLDRQAGEAPVTVQAHYGQPAFAASNLGRRVRVWERVEFRRGPRGPVVTSRVYTLDTVLGN